VLGLDQLKADDHNLEVTVSNRREKH